MRIRATLVAYAGLRVKLGMTLVSWYRLTLLSVSMYVLYHSVCELATIYAHNYV